MSFVSEMEQIIKSNGARGLEVLLNYHGLDLELYRQVTCDDVYGKVHNKNSGNPVEVICNFQGAIAGDDFFPMTAQQAGVFHEAWLFTESDKIRPGDEIRIVRNDGRRMAYRVEENPGVGQTTQIFTKWKLSGIM